MRKSLAVGIMTSLIVAVVSSVQASPVDINGDIRYEFREWKDTVNDIGNDHVTGELLRIRVNAAGKIDPNTTAFARIGSRKWSGSSNTTEAELDQYGVKLRGNGGWTYTLGRQALALGQGSILMSGYDVSIDNKFDGLVAAGKLGGADVTLIAGKTTGNAAAPNEFVPRSSTAIHSDPTGWLGLDYTFRLNNDSSLGLVYASAKNYGGHAIPAIKYQGFNTAVNLTDRFSLSGEYVKSNADADNQAYFLAANYDWGKDSINIRYHDVGVRAVDPFNSGIGAPVYPFEGDGLPYVYNNVLASPGNKYTGFTYTYNHKLTKAATLTVSYMNLKSDLGPGSDKEFKTGVLWNF